MFNLLDENIHTTKKYAKILLVASKEVGTEVNTEQNKYIFMSCLMNVGQTCNMKVTNSFLKYDKAQTLENYS
jgi:hypothetical protein